MKDRRRIPRFYFECAWAYLPGHKEPFKVTNFSLRGCFIRMDDPPYPGTILNFELVLPSVGRLPIRGIVMHQGGFGTKGAGVQFLEIEGEFHHVYAKFLKALQVLEEARQIYEKIVSNSES